MTTTNGESENTQPSAATENRKADGNLGQKPRENGKAATTAEAGEEKNEVRCLEPIGSPSGNAPGQWDKIIAALLEKPTLAAAAEALGINPSTLYRVMRHPAFMKDYREARRRIVGQAIAQLQTATGIAVETLRGIIADAKAPVWARINASTAVLEQAVKAVETEEYESRISAIEATLEEYSEEHGKKTDAE